ncbi:DUF5641 domain-containing protein [Trichonephila clavipes]|uniref:DUF5641 domain-containing protein n=1 Tax=Trichonephila clavipes TaxID=2585209 RepID=A0A8X6RI24_TRICX|nr:DUF5641 domain-containing protein [Trichonephila clavipes]
MVRSIKELLRKCLGKACVTYKEMLTLLYDCEATINGRPLTYLSDDPKELKPLTPAHFIQDIKERETFDLDLIDSPHILKRVRYLRTLRSNLRKHFYKKYLGELKSLTIRLTFAEKSFLTLADGAKYSLSCRKQITHFLNFYTLADGAHKILSSLSERKSPSPDIHTALTGGAHRFQLLSSRGKSRLPLAWHSRMRSASDQSVLPPKVVEGV